MPIYVGYTQKRRTINVVTAGGDQFLLCPPGQITIKAELNDETNLRNLTRRWVQTKGIDVVLADPEALETTFPFATTEDKTFRYVLDEGTSRERYKELNIFYTPTSIANESNAKGIRNTTTYTVPNLTSQPTLLTPPLDGSFNADVPGIDGTRYQWDPVSVGGWVGNEVKLEILSDPNYVVDPEVVYATYLPDDYPYDLRLPNGVYKFRYYYSFPGGIIKYVDSPLIVSNSFTEDKYRIIHDVYGPNLSQSRLNELKRVSIARQAISHEELLLDSVVVGFSQNIVRFTPVRVDYINYPILNDEYKIVHTTQSALSNVTRLDPSNIGN